MLFSLASRTLVEFLRSIVSFLFHFFLRFRLYSSAVLPPPFCIPLQFSFCCFFLSLYSTPPPPQPPFLRSLSLLVPSLFFALPLVFALPCWSPYVLLLRSSSAFVCFAFFPYGSLGLAASLSLSLSPHLPLGVSLQHWYYCYRVASPIGFAIVCRFLSSAPLSFSFIRMGWGGGGGGLSFVLFLLPECVFFFHCTLRGFLLFFLSSSFFRFFPQCLVILRCAEGSCTCRPLPSLLSRLSSLSLSSVFPCRLLGFGICLGSPA